MADDGPTRNKRRKENRSNGILYSEIKKAALSLIDGHFYSLSALEFKGNNSTEGFPFSSANCIVSVPTEKRRFYSFGCIFTHGTYILSRYLQNEDETLQREDQALCDKLINFLADTSKFEEYIVKDEDDMSSVKNKTNLSVMLAEHLLKKLSIEETYVLDFRNQTEHDKENSVCKCGQFHCGENKYRDTSIGNKKVWHGYIDILLGNGSNEVPVYIPDIDKLYSDGKLPVECKYRNLTDKGVSDHIIAQTIVFSFLQRKRHSSDNSLYPCIGICSTDVIFCFYDSKLDVLLQSSKFPLYRNGALNYAAIIAIWLVVNYRYVARVTHELTEMATSKFFNLADEVIDIYREELMFGKIGDINMDEDETDHRHLVNSKNFLLPRNRAYLNFDH